MAYFNAHGPVLGLIGAAEDQPGTDPLIVDGDALNARLQESSVRQALAGTLLEQLEELFGGFIGGPAALARWAEGAPVATDDRPSVERLAAVSGRSTLSPHSIAFSPERRTRRCLWRCGAMKAKPGWRPSRAIAPPSSRRCTDRSRRPRGTSTTRAAITRRASQPTRDSAQIGCSCRNCGEATASDATTAGALERFQLEVIEFCAAPTEGGRGRRAEGSAGEGPDPLPAPPAPTSPALRTGEVRSLPPRTLTSS